MTKYDIYGIGAALVDTEIEVTELDLRDLSIEKGVMTLVDETRQDELIEKLSDYIDDSKLASGGSAANSIFAASYFGAKSFYSCLVANDKNGEFYLNDLANAGVDFHRDNGSKEGITGKCLVLITPDAERTLNTYLGISERLSINDIDEEALSMSKYAYIEGYLVTSETGLPAAIRLRELAEQHQVKTAISLSDPAIVRYFGEPLKQVIGERQIDLLFCNEAEAMAFCETESLDQAIEKIKHFCRTFAITLGAKGAIVFDGAALSTVAGHAVKAVDTNGAGDMFAGAFMAALSQGKDFRQAGEFASKCASVVVSQFGPRLSEAQHKALAESHS